MSNAKTTQGADCEPSSRWPSATPPASNGGATATPSVSKTHSSTPSSSGQATSSGTPIPAPTTDEIGTLAERIAAPEYLDRVGTVAERIASASGQAAVQSLLTEGMVALGAENAIFVSFMRDNLRVSSCRFMLACDPAWCRQYLDAELIASDPWLGERVPSLGAAARQQFEGRGARPSAAPSSWPRRAASRRPCSYPFTPDRATHASASFALARGSLVASRAFHSGASSSGQGCWHASCTSGGWPGCARNC